MKHKISEYAVARKADLEVNEEQDEIESIPYAEEIREFNSAKDLLRFAITNYFLDNDQFNVQNANFFPIVLDAINIALDERENFVDINLPERDLTPDYTALDVIEQMTNLLRLREEEIQEQELLNESLD